MPDFAADAEKSRSEKIALRGRLLTARAAMTASDRLRAAASVQAVVVDVVRRSSARRSPVGPPPGHGSVPRRPVVAAYAPIGSEPGGADLPEVLAEHARVLLPLLLDDGDLDWAEYDGPLRPGPRGLRQPAGPGLGLDAVRSADLVIVPALAVDRHGLRLGRGGGSYDRVLARIAVHGSTPSAPGTFLSGPMTVALLYDGELVDTVPADAHDRPVRAAITPGGGLTICEQSPCTPGPARPRPVEEPEAG